MPQKPFDPSEKTVPELQAAMQAGQTTAQALTRFYLGRIRAFDGALRSVLETNPDASTIAKRLDAERARGQVRGPLHGIPVLLKDNIDTGDRMQTTAGSRVLLGSPATQDAPLVAALREAGAVILGKTNLTEWANFMTTDMPSGYSSRGGQTINPYNKAITPGGSSSGSAVAVAANFCAVAVGTETSGSILNPAHQNSLVGLKPTLGLVSRTGIVPIASSQDTAGPLARSVVDAAALLQAMVCPDPLDASTHRAKIKPGVDFVAGLKRGALRGARIGVPRAWFTEHLGKEQQKLFARSLSALKKLGATLVDADLPSAAPLADVPYTVLVYEFKRDLERYLKRRKHPNIKTMRDIIRANERDPKKLLRYGQTLLLAAQAVESDNTAFYHQARKQDLLLSRKNGIDAYLKTQRLDAIFTPSFWGCIISAKAGYPSVILPAGFMRNNQPFGVTFLGAAYSEARLLCFAYDLEQHLNARRAPTLAP